MTISVALCTYNGARFIVEQLYSIINQTIRVGEIVVCDDGSLDDTIEIVRKIIEETTIPIHLYINEYKLGCIKNFEKAISLCQGDIIFLSDQDDVWMNNKVETIVSWFDENPTKNVVFGDAILINENGDYILRSQYHKSLILDSEQDNTPIRLWEDSGFTKKSQEQFDRGLALELWCQMNRATGATMAFRKEIRQLFNKDYGEYIYHDFIISFSALLGNQLGYIEQPLIKYRQHENQTIGCNLNKNKHKGWDDARLPYIPWCNMDIFTLKDRDKLRIDFMEKRMQFKYSFLGLEIIQNMFHYIKCYHKHWYTFVEYDFKEAFAHTMCRIKNKIL